MCVCVSCYYYKIDLTFTCVYCSTRTLLKGILGIEPLLDAIRTFDSDCFAAAAVVMQRVLCVHNLKTYYVITTIEKSEKFVDGGGDGKTVVF